MAQLVGQGESPATHGTCGSKLNDGSPAPQREATFGRTRDDFHLDTQDLSNRSRVSRRVAFDASALEEGVERGVEFS